MNDTNDPCDEARLASSSSVSGWSSVWSRLERSHPPPEGGDLCPEPVTLGPVTLIDVFAADHVETIPRSRGSGEVASIEIPSDAFVLAKDELRSETFEDER